MIVVKLGKTQREAHVHRILLRSRSPYFRRILEDRNVQTSKITLYDVEADVFFMFLSWLYADCFVPPRHDNWLSLCKLWLAAERFQVNCNVKSYIRLSLLTPDARFQHYKTKSSKYLVAVCIREKSMGWTLRYFIMCTTTPGQDRCFEKFSLTSPCHMGGKMCLLR